MNNFLNGLVAVLGVGGIALILLAWITVPFKKIWRFSAFVLLLGFILSVLSFVTSFFKLYHYGV